MNATVFAESSCSSCFHLSLSVLCEYPQTWESGRCHTLLSFLTFFLSCSTYFLLTFCCRLCAVSLGVMSLASDEEPARYEHDSHRRSRKLRGNEFNCIPWPSARTTEFWVGIKIYCIIMMTLVGCHMNTIIMVLFIRFL